METQRNELRHWVKENAALVTVTGVMIAAAVFSRGIGAGKGVLWLISCFLLLALLLMQEMFESFPAPGHDSEKLKGFKWVLGAAMANLVFYWVVVVYKASGTFFAGLVCTVVGLTGGEWLARKLGMDRRATPKRRLLGVAVIVGGGLLGSGIATIGIPNMSPKFEENFFGSTGAGGSTGERDSVLMAVNSALPDTAAHDSTSLSPPPRKVAPLAGLPPTKAAGAQDAKAVTWAEGLGAIASLIGSIAALVGVFFAVRKYGEWRRELHGRRKFRLAEQVLLAAHEFAETLRATRSRGYTLVLSRETGETDTLKLADARQAEYEARLDRMWRMYRRLQIARSRARALLGEEAASELEALATLGAGLAITARQYFPDERRWVANQDEERHQSLQEEHRELFGEDGDDFSKRVAAALGKIESRFRPFVTE